MPPTILQAKSVTTQASGEADASPAPRRRGRQRSTNLDIYDSIVWRLKPQWQSSAEPGTFLGVVGVTEGVGTSTVAANLASRLVEHAEGPVLLVDANLYRPRAHRLLRGKKNPGLAEVLAGHAELSDAVHSTRTPGLDLMPSGRAGLLHRVSFPGESVQALRHELLERYTAIVLDLPAATNLGPAVLLAQQLDGALLVVQADRSRAADVERAAKRLQTDEISVIGTLLNRQHDYVPSWLRRWV